MTTMTIMANQRFRLLLIAITLIRLTLLYVVLTYGLGIEGFVMRKQAEITSFHGI